MTRARRELERMRRTASAWQQLRYERTTGADGYDVDRNLTHRAMVLWALQYDRGPEDLPLLRWLVEQEATCRRAAPFQGLTVETELAGFLLAEHRHVEDVWLQWTVKRANFDTWCDEILSGAAAGPSILGSVTDAGRPVCARGPGSRRGPARTPLVPPARGPATSDQPARQAIEPPGAGRGGDRRNGGQSPKGGRPLPSTLPPPMTTTVPSRPSGIRIVTVSPSRGTNASGSHFTKPPQPPQPGSAGRQPHPPHAGCLPMVRSDGPRGQAQSRQLRDQ